MGLRGFSPSQRPGERGPRGLRAAGVLGGACNPGGALLRARQACVLRHGPFLGWGGPGPPSAAGSLPERWHLGRWEAGIRFPDQVPRPERGVCFLAHPTLPPPAGTRKGPGHAGSHAFAVRPPVPLGRTARPPASRPRSPGGRGPWRAPPCLRDTACLAAPYLWGQERSPDAVPPAAGRSARPLCRSVRLCIGGFWLEERAVGKGVRGHVTCTLSRLGRLLVSVRPCLMVPHWLPLDCRGEVSQEKHRAEREGGMGHPRR